MKDTERCVNAWRRLESLPLDFVAQVNASDEMREVLAASHDVRAAALELAYLRSGQEVILAVENALRSCGRELSAADSVLEFACGFGRVARFLRTRLPTDRVWASDILPAAVEFVEHAFGVHAFNSTQNPEDLVWPRRFEIVIVPSLFSHLPARRFQPWLEKLRESLTDDGLLLFTTHGTSLPTAPSDSSSDFRFVPISESRSLSPDEYGSTYISPSLVTQFVRNAGFVEVSWIEREVWMLQDLFLARRTFGKSSQWDHAPILEGAIDGIQSDAGGSFWIHGWAASRKLDEPIDRAELHVDDQIVAAVVLHPPQRQELVSPRPVRQVKSEWHLDGRLPPDLYGTHTIALVVRTVGGSVACVDVRVLDVRERRVSMR